MGKIYSVSKNPLQPMLAINERGENVLPKISEIDNSFTPGINGLTSSSWDDISWNTLTLDLGDLSDYDEIKLVFDKPTTKHHRINRDVRFTSVIHTETTRSTGLEIIQERENFVILKKISESSMREFDSILRRIFLLLIDSQLLFFQFFLIFEDLVDQDLKEAPRFAQKSLLRCLTSQLHL